jgi:hypothetical protein
MSTDTLRTVAVTMICCGIAALFVLHRKERRHAREMHQAREMWREALWQARVAAPVLSRRERAAFNAIAARLDDAGLGILGSEGEYE